MRGPRPVLSETLAESLCWTLVVAVVLLDLITDPLVHWYQLAVYRLGWRLRHFGELLSAGVHRVRWQVRQAADRSRGYFRTAAGRLRTGGYHIRDWVRARWAR